jgi:membrane protease YdiL (CAAX protease family)
MVIGEAPLFGRPLIQSQGSTDGRLRPTEIVWRIFLMDQTSSQHDNPTPSLFHLFTSVLSLGATAYGGPAMIAHIKETAVNRYGWVREGEFMRGLALCQLIPGATMVLIVTYIGYRTKGIWGALTAAVAFVLLSLQSKNSHSLSVYLRWAPWPSAAGSPPSL